MQFFCMKEVSCNDVVDSLSKKMLIDRIYTIFKAQSKHIVRDAQSFSQTYRDVERIKSLDINEWLKRRNLVVVSALNMASHPITQHLPSRNACW